MTLQYPASASRLSDSLVGPAISNPSSPPSSTDRVLLSISGLLLILLGVAIVELFIQVPDSLSVMPRFVVISTHCESSVLKPMRPSHYHPAAASALRVHNTLSCLFDRIFRSRMLLKGCPSAPATARKQVRDASTTDEINCDFSFKSIRNKSAGALHSFPASSLLSCQLSPFPTL